METDLLINDDWFEALSQQRRHGWEAVRANNWERGIRQSTVDKYADPIHFLYELLQNAEDQGATSATFVLTRKKLSFAHNGKEFRRADVENITGIGNSEKPQEANKIGRFGIGFKSVFVITDRPQIHTTIDGTPFAFAIENLVVPVRLEDANGVARAGKTQFTLGFKPNPTTDIFVSIRDRLRTLGADTLLFLDRLTTIRWDIEGKEEGVLRCKREEEGRVCRLTEEVGPTGNPVKRPSVTYLVYSKGVEGIQGADRRLTVSIAYRLERETIVAEKGQVTANVYFPTEEKTGLHFRLHAPFLLNDSRANIKKNCPENTLLIQTCAEVFALSLLDLKERGLLTASCLNMLPIRAQDFAGSPFRPLYDAMYHTVKTQELLPTQTGSSKSHVRAANAKITDSKPLRNLFSEGQLTSLYEGTRQDPICWLDETIQKNVTKDLWDYLMHDLSVEEVDGAKVARRIDDVFLKSQKDTWMMAFYIFLNDQPALWRAASASYPRGPLRSKSIVRLEEGTGPFGVTHIAPFGDDNKPNAYLPLKKGGQGFPTVKRSLLQNDEVERFFQSLGLRTPDVVDRLTTFVLPRYTGEEGKVSDGQGYVLDLDEIADAVENLGGDLTKRSQLSQILIRTPFIRSVRADNPNISAWKRPAEVYQRTQDVLDWFGGNPNTWIVGMVASQHPRWAAICHFLQQYASSAVPVAPRMSARYAGSGGYVSVKEQRGKNERGVSGFDPDATLDGIDHALRMITPQRARQLWHRLIAYPFIIHGTVESSRYATFQPIDKREDSYSVLGQACKNARWLPDSARTTWHVPCKIRLADLPDDWDKKSSGAKEVASRLGLYQPKEQAMADEFGVPVDILSRLIEAYKRDPVFVTEQLNANRLRPDLPTTDTPYSERRSNKIAQEVEEAPEIRFEKRERSVRVSGGAVKAESKAYLREKYTNEDGQMICQICNEIMPFTLEDGSYYFEAVPFLSEIEKEAKQNALALCPLCAALYQYGNWENAPGALREAILRDPGPQFPLYLAGVEESIWFHPHHLGDMRAVLSVVGVSR